MNIACHYALVRFMPFIETGEFGNVGVVLFAPTARFFGFELLGQRIARITRFFDQVEPALFRASMVAMRAELQRISEMLCGADADQRLFEPDRANRLWQEIVKPRESTLRFSNPRLALAGDPETKLHELFGFYVERSFVTRQYQEELMERSVRGWLQEAHLSQRFQAMRVGNDEFSARFPFVARVDDRPGKALKPLHLGQPDPVQIIEHGGQWRVRVEALKKRGLLPEHVLFAVDGDLSGEGTAARARRDVVDGLLALDVQVGAFADRSAVIGFAEA